MVFPLLGVDLMLTAIDKQWSEWKRKRDVIVSLVLFHALFCPAVTPVPASILSHKQSNNLVKLQNYY